MADLSNGRTPLDEPWWPDHLVVGWFGRKRDADAALRQVRANAGDRTSVYVFSGPAAADRLAKLHQGNILKRMTRWAWWGLFIDAIRFRELELAGRRGGYIVVVQAPDDAIATDAAHHLATYGGREVSRFSRREGVNVVGPRAAS